MSLTKQDILDKPFNKRDFSIGYVPPSIYFMQIISMFSYEAISISTLSMFDIRDNDKKIRLLDYCDVLYNRSYRLNCENIFISNKYVVFLTNLQNPQNKNYDSVMFGFLYNGRRTVSDIYNIAYDIEMDSSENNKWEIVV